MNSKRCSNSLTHSPHSLTHSRTHPPTHQPTRLLDCSIQSHNQPLNNRVFISLQHTYRDQCKSNGIKWPQQAIIVVKPAATTEWKNLLHNRSINDQPNNPSQDYFIATFHIVWSQNQSQQLFMLLLISRRPFILMLSGLAGKTSGLRILEYAADNQNVFSKKPYGNCSYYSSWTKGTLECWVRADTREGRTTGPGKPWKHRERSSTWPLNPSQRLMVLGT